VRYKSVAPVRQRRFHRARLSASTQMPLRRCPQNGSRARRARGAHSSGPHRAQSPPHEPPVARRYPHAPPRHSLPFVAGRCGGLMYVRSNVDFTRAGKFGTKKYRVPIEMPNQHPRLFGSISDKGNYVTRVCSSPIARGMRASKSKDLQKHYKGPAPDKRIKPRHLRPLRAVPGLRIQLAPLPVRFALRTWAALLRHFVDQARRALAHFAADGLSRYRRESKPGSRCG
jgi:hypothetical protein